MSFVSSFLEQRVFTILPAQGDSKRRSEETPTPHI